MHDSEVVSAGAWQGAASTGAAGLSPAEQQVHGYITLSSSHLEDMWSYVNSVHMMGVRGIRNIVHLLRGSNNAHVCPWDLEGMLYWNAMQLGDNSHYWIILELENLEKTTERNF